MNGVIIVNKPKGITSRDVVNHVSKTLNVKKVGHNGTLDPLAEGVLVICIGKYTKLNSLLTSEEKEYIAEVTLGVRTDTLDITGNVLEKRNETLDIDKLNKAFNTFPRKYMQEVPKYSAVKINGRKLYEYARENIEVLLPSKEVEIKLLEILSYDSNRFTFKTLVSKGTYIRSLIKDILGKMDTIGTMSNLKRTKQGKFHIEDACSLEDIENGDYNLLHIKDIFDIPIVKVNENLRKRIINGSKIEGDYPNRVLFIDESNNELAIYKRENGMMRVEIML